MNLRIALADDQALVRKGLKALLTQPGIAVVIEAANGDELLVALESTAVDVIVSDIRMPGTPEELKLAIERVARGESLLQPVTTTSLSPAITLVERPRPPSSSTDGAPELTERERSVLRLMAAGHSNKEIARSLDPGTVKNYVSDILDKLQTGDRTRAVLKAIHQRLI